MQISKAVGYMGQAALIVVACASVAAAQDMGNRQIQEFSGRPGLTPDKRVDSALQVPRCMRRSNPVDPPDRMAPGSSGFVATLFLMSLCSSGVELSPIPVRHSWASEEFPTATSFEQLAVLVHPGETVRLTDVAGSRVEGRIQGLTPSTLSLMTGGTTRDFNLGDVAVIRQRKADSLADGARKGAVTGAAIGLLSLLTCGGECMPALLLPIGVMTATGAGIGVAYDAMYRETRTIYRRPALSFRF